MSHLLDIAMPVTKEELTGAFDEGQLSIEEIYESLEGEYTYGEIYRALQQQTRSVGYDKETEKYYLK